MSAQDQESEGDSATKGSRSVLLLARLRVCYLGGGPAAPLLAVGVWFAALVFRIVDAF